MTKAENLETLANLAHEGPVVTALSDLSQRIIYRRHGIETIPSLREFYRRFEDPNSRFSTDVIIHQSGQSPYFDRNLTTYEPPDTTEVTYLGDPYDSELNELVAADVVSWEEIQDTTRTQSSIADYIKQRSGSEDVVVAVLIDGLSYNDWQKAGYDAEPVFVDCPTITECGYPNIVYGGGSGESLANRLYQRGFKNRLAFTYWEKTDSKLTDSLHRSFSPNDIIGDIQDFDNIIAYLNREDWKTNTNTFIQITLTGPERVAHRLKEDPDPMHQADVVRKKLLQLNEVLSEHVSSHRIYATADHGILWRMEAKDDFTIIKNGGWNHQKRRCLKNPKAEIEIPDGVAINSMWEGDQYFQLGYPYLFHGLRSNEPGVHGGYSFQESIVPLIEMGQ